MNIDYVKFKRGSQKAFDYLKENDKLNYNTLYFIYDKDNPDKAGKVYLGKYLISDDEINKLNIKFNINEEELDDGQVLVYKNGKWENQVIGEIGEGTTAKIEWGHF